MNTRDYLTWSASLLAILIIDGCAVLPDSVRPELSHMSHLSQHRPCTDSPTNYGSNLASIALHWNLPARAYIELVEGLDLDKHWTNVGTEGNGEIVGPREQTSIRLGWVFTVPK